jgi:cystathionine beta-lyase
VSAATTTPVLRLPTTAELRAAGSAKWSRVPGALGASVAEMDFGTAPVVVDALVRAGRDGPFGYLPGALAGALAEACADHQRERFGWALDPARVRPVGDVIVGLETVIESFTPPGSPIVVLTPAYMPFLTVPGRIGRRVIEVPVRPGTRGAEIDLDGVEGALRAGARLVILCNPHNPVGRVYREAELRALAEVVERHGARVFADEIHAELTYPGHPHVPYATVDDAAAAHAVTATSASKAWNIPGLKCAQLILAPGDNATWERVRHSASRGASTLGAVATIAAYRDGGPWLAAVQELLVANRARLGADLARRLPQLATAPPEGTYLAWLDCRALDLPGAPAEFFLRRAGVALTDGAACGTAGAGFVRLNFATPPAVLDEIVDAMATAVHPGRR